MASTHRYVFDPRPEGVVFHGMEGGFTRHVRHGGTLTTHAIRAAIQRSQAWLATLNREFGSNPKTGVRWRKRRTLEDMTTGLKEQRSTTLSEAEEAMVVAFRGHTLLPYECVKGSIAAVA